MTVPVATYRLQFREGMTLARAAELVDYLRRLGIGHLYASPLFTATPGSTHGYDVTDFGEIDPAIGGEIGFVRLAETLHAAGLGLLLDFVPNHMAAADGNLWWQGVLEWGAESLYAGYFDIDWSEPKLILPILGKPYVEALQDGTFGVGFDAAAGQFYFTCYDRRLRLAPPTYAMLLNRVKRFDATSLAARFFKSTVETSPALKRRLAALVADEAEVAAEIATLVAGASQDHTFLNDLHEEQPWRLAHWPVGRDSLTYRSFFEIDDLICLRVEDRAVFDAVHKKLFDLVACKSVTGIRLDHIDGLADPKGYLRRLQQETNTATPPYLLVEKILEPGETLRPDWPVAGTTGYEFIAALAGLFTDQQQEAAWDTAYEEFSGSPAAYDEAVLNAKREILAVNLAADLAILVSRLRDVSAADIRTRDFGTDTLRRAIIEVAAALPVYRTYVTKDGPDQIDSALIAQATADAAEARRVENPAAIDFVAKVLLRDVDGWTDNDSAIEFLSRFQQTTGPVMAKALEDTVFYRENRLIALNEVGCSGHDFGASRNSFHATMEKRLRTQPAGLSATATHDTKRGEDARARLYALSEVPNLWREAVARWSSLNAPHRTELPDGSVPEPATEWLFYQALTGAWPLTLKPDANAELDTNGLADLRRRMRAYMEKAIREAKLRTSWINQNAAYEDAVARFVTGTLSLEANQAFLSDFYRTCDPIWVAGAVNGLAQLAIKLAAPGVPDLYQGNELWDFSLVDPDNRRPVDFPLRRDMLNQISRSDPVALLNDWRSGAPKLALTTAGLQVRRRHPELFDKGMYVPLEVTGTHARHLLAFARALGDRCIILIVPRFFLTLAGAPSRPFLECERWGNTEVLLRENVQVDTLYDLVTGAIHKASDRLCAAAALSQFPVALLICNGDRV